ncbi:MAG: hypothetical protein R2762_03295 [Bryobacteraceae bacterium]
MRHGRGAGGFTEVYNYSFISHEQATELGLDPAAHVRVTNPIASDQGLLGPRFSANSQERPRQRATGPSAGSLKSATPSNLLAGGLPRETPWLGACGTRAKATAQPDSWRPSGSPNACCPESPSARRHLVRTSTPSAPWEVATSATPP